MTEKVAILHTNDLHSHFENWPRVRRYLLSERQILIKKGYQVITVDDGDAIDRWHPLTDATNGQANVKQMNRVHYDAATIGNNEGLNNAHSVLNHLYDHANFPIVLDNLIDPKTGRIPQWAHADKIIKGRDGTRIMLVGLTRAYKNGYQPLHWKIKDLKEAIPPLLKNIRGRYDILILLSHLGVDRDRYIAAHYPEFDIIVGGHSHHLFRHGEKDRRTLLVAARKFGYYVGRIKLIIKHHRIVKENAATVKTSQLPSQPGDRKEIQDYFQHGDQLLKDQKVADVPFTMRASLHGNANIISEGLKAIMERTHTRAAMLSSGMFLHTIPKGIISMKQIHDCLPHSVFPMRSILSGTSLWMLMKEIQKNRHFLSMFHQKGMGFRGKIFGDVHCSGIKFNPKTQVVSYLGRPVLPNHYYSIGMLDHYMFVPFFPVISIMGRNHIFHDKFLRVVFAEYLHRHYPIHK